VRRWPLLSLFVLSSGCLEAVAPEVGEPLREECRNDDHDPGVAIDFQRDIVDGIFKSDEYHCLKCHSEYGDTPLGFYVGGLDLSTYEGLRAGGAQSGANIVIPGRPCDSVIYKKISAGPPFGSRMPLDGPPYLDDEDEEIIADWIAEGAHGE
jgi:hypothetical protein